VKLPYDALRFKCIPECTSLLVPAIHEKSSVIRSTALYCRKLRFRPKANFWNTISISLTSS
jgi:hypothetical protein